MGWVRLIKLIMPKMEGLNMGWVGIIIKISTPLFWFMILELFITNFDLGLS